MNNVNVNLNKISMFSEQISLVENVYNTLKDRFDIPHKLSWGKIKIMNFDEFNLSNGGKIISQNSFLGRDLASYTSYAAFTNQFFNAKLMKYHSSIEYTKDEIENLLHEKYELLSDISNIDKKYRLLESNFDFNNFNQSEKRNVKKMIYEFIIDRETNISMLKEVDIPLSTKFIISYFNRFSTETPTDIEMKIIRYQEWVNENKFSIRNENYFKKYETCPIFLEDVENICSLIHELKTIYPLGKSFTDFFRDFENTNNLDKKFYYFIIETMYFTKSKQISYNGIREYHREIILEY